MEDQPQLQQSVISHPDETVAPRSTKLSKKVSFSERVEVVFAAAADADAEVAEARTPPPSGGAAAAVGGASVSWESVRNFVRERSKSVSEVLRRVGLDDGAPPVHLAGTQNPRENSDGDDGDDRIVDPQKEDESMKGRVTVFTRSGCAECAAARRILRDGGMRFVEINLDVFPEREAEMRERVGGVAPRVPQVFVNEQLLGGIVALRSLLNSGVFEERVRAGVARPCPADAPQAPVYGVDPPPESEAPPDAVLDLVQLLRQKLPFQDRFSRFRMYTNCFTGADAVEVLIHEIDCGRKKAVEIGKQIANKKFFRHINDENDFEDGNHLYRFLEHDPTISSKCLNFVGFTNDDEPKLAVVVAEHLRKILLAIRESYVSEDGEHVNYLGIQSSEEFRRYCKLARDLQRIDLKELTESQRLAFFLNIYNSLAIHSIIRRGYHNGMIERRQFFNDSQYVIGGYPFSLSQIHNGILRGNRRPPLGLTKPFKQSDPRNQLSFPKLNNAIHLALCNGAKSGPPLRFFSPGNVDSELREAARDFFRKNGMAVDVKNNTIHLNQIFNWFDMDFGDLQMLHWIMSFLEEPKASALSTLVNRKGPIDVVYTSYDWSINV